MTRRSRFAASVLLTTGLIGGGAQAGAQQPLIAVTGQQGCGQPAPASGTPAGAVEETASAGAVRRRGAAGAVGAACAGDAADATPAQASGSLLQSLGLGPFAAGVGAVLAPLVGPVLVAAAPFNWADFVAALGQMI